MSRPIVGRRLMVSTVDYHTAGEPFRIVSGGVPGLQGKTILEKRRFALLLYGTVMVFMAFDRQSHSASDTLRPFVITMAPVWIVAIAGAMVLLRSRAK